MRILRPILFLLAACPAVVLLLEKGPLRRTGPVLAKLAVPLEAARHALTRAGGAKLPVALLDSCAAALRLPQQLVEPLSHEWVGKGESTNAPTLEAALACDSRLAGAAFEAAWPRLQPGGVFIVADMLRNERGPTHNSLFTPSGYRSATLAGTPRDGGIKRLLDTLIIWMACRNMAQTDFKDAAGVALARTIRSVDCWQGGTCFVRKAGSAETDLPLAPAEAQAQGLKTWSSIAAGTRTDKITTHAYQWAYDRYLPRYLESAKRTGSTVRLFEIGLGCGMPWGAGASAPTWLSYFMDVPFELTYLEYDAPCLAQWLRGAGADTDKRITGYAGDQRDAVLLSRISAQRGPFDIIVDDGGHSMAMQITSLRTLIPSLVPGGAYVLEDLQTSLWDRESFMTDGPPYGLGYVLDVAQLVADAGQGGEYTADQRAVAAAVSHVDMYAECAVFVAV
jgi:hypothetical protein